MKVSELLRSLADMVASAEGGGVTTGVPGAAEVTTEPAQDAQHFEPSDHKEADSDKFVPPLQAKLEILKKSVGMDNVYDEVGDVKRMAGISPTQQEAADDEPFEG